MSRYRITKRQRMLRDNWAPVGEEVLLSACLRHDRVMGLLSDIEAEIEFVHLTAAGRVAVVFWSCMGHSYRELDPDVQVKLIRRDAVTS